jgi:tRNA(Ile)-lysidine synthase
VTPPPSAQDAVIRALAGESGPLLVALSGGRDSLTLLHILRFDLGPESLGGLHALHVDHGMHPASSDQALRLRGVCGAWGVPLTIVSLDPPPESEAEAREGRYRALLAEAERLGAPLILTGHQSDDQVETVLFRILRGTGPRGLQGIPVERRLGSARILRPLLSVPGAQVAEAARGRRLRPLEDPTNRELLWARNRIRLELLPALTRVIPELPATLLALAEAARGREAILTRILDRVEAKVVVGGSGVEEAPLAMARPSLLLYPPAIQGELLRRLLRRFGRGISRKGLALALRFAATGGRHRSVTVAPGVRLRRGIDELDLFVRPHPGMEGEARNFHDPEGSP